MVYSRWTRSPAADDGLAPDARRGLPGMLFYTGYTCVCWGIEQDERL